MIPTIKVAVPRLFTGPTPDLARTLQPLDLRGIISDPGDP